MRLHALLLRAAAFVLVFFTSLRVFAAAPTASTSAATSLTTSSAVLNGAGNPNGQDATGWFRYDTTNPGTCNDTFGTRVPATSGTDLGTGSASVPYSITATGLSSGVTYYFCAIVSNASGTAYGSVLSFTVPGLPQVVTSAATSVSSSGATLQGSANPVASSTTGWFRYATTNPGSCNDTFGTRAPASGGSALGAGTSPVGYSLAVSSLLPGNTYYYCAIASNAFGTSVGAVLSFVTPPTAPAVTTNAVTSLAGTTATLNGTANPDGDTTTGWFRYATTNPGTCSDSFGTRTPATGGSALGSGNAGIAYSQPVVGLTPLTTYYYCAIAQNPEGTTWGTVVSFTTPAVPTVTTTAATNINNTNAYLNGSGIPNGTATTGWFRFALTNPGTCDDIFGSRSPASGGTSLGSGTSATAYSQQITGLSPGTTYYYCAIASNSVGTGFGAVLSFTTSSVPAVVTSAATAVTSTAATLNGSANPDGASTYAYFEYSTTNPGSCTSSFGSTTSSSYLGTGTTAAAYSYNLTGLTPATTYYFCAWANNTYGNGYGAVLSFKTPATAPAVTTNAATLLTGTTATLNGTANPGGDTTTGWFRYATASPGSCNDTFGTRAPSTSGAALGSGNGNVAYSQAITGLTPGTTYYFCAIAQNPEGTAFGTVVSFLTPVPPTVTTTAATNINNTNAYINGSGIPNGAAATGWLRYSTTNPGTCNDTFGSRVPATGGTSLGSGYSAVAFSQQITALSPGGTYYFCAIVSSSEGTAFGAVLSFVASTVPAVTTSAATSVTSTTATLNGSADPDGASTYAYFEYSTTNPGSCTSSFGSTSSSSYLGTGTTAAAYSYSLTGLTPATTYYYCAWANNTYGNGYGAVLSFTTVANPPTVTTNTATPLTGTTATLNGTANPGGDTTTGWFRYATTSPGSCNDTFGTRAPSTGGSAVGSGASNVAYSQAITGLTPGTTYYYCAIVQNPEGTAFGSVVSFLTPLPPTVTTTAATNVTNSSAYINGSGIPNGAATTGWLRFALTSPGTCNDTFGSRVPATGGTSLGSGYSAVAFSQQITGLSAGTTYYYCAIVSSSEGTAFGTVLSFTASGVPTVTTNAATSVASATATLNGTADPNGASTYAYFEYSTTNPGSCSSSFGSTSSSSYLGTGTTAAAYSYNLTGLTPGTTYYYCAWANNTYGNGYGAVLSFKTLATAPAVSTLAASPVSTTTATLNGQANPEGDTTTGWFRYGTASPGSCNDSFGTRAPSASGTGLLGGTSYVSYSQALTGLSPATTYYFCAIAQNPEGLSFGSVVSFTTTAAPTVSTLAATPVTATTATLNGTVNPNGYATTGWFEYGTNNPGTCNGTFGTATTTTSLGSGTTSVGLPQAVTALTPATTYYFCAIAQSSIGTTYGAVLSFTTPAAPPSVTTVAASALTGTTAALNASDDPNGSDTTSWFRYSATSPGSCNDTFGTRVPATGGDDLGAGSSAVADSQAITGLTAGTTYYFCALASSAIGNSVGSLLSFTAPSGPTVITQAATAVASTTATLNGSGTPNLSATTAWFRYDTTSPGTCNDTFGTRSPASGGSALGAGSAAVAYSQALTGLAPATTYYFCAIAQNAVSTGFGAVLNFTTASAPTVTTVAASAVSGTGATLNGTANPNLITATGWLRYSATNPGTCNDTFGTRTPASGGTALGAGNGAVPYSQTITGLAAGTTYYFCAIASNSAGTGFGAVLSFVTAGAPVVTTVAASGVTDTTATLNGSADPNLLSATGWLRYSATNPGTCNDTFGTRAPASGGTALGAGASAVPYSQAITGLTQSTTYYFCAIASNSAGTAFGAVLTFTTLGDTPVVTTSAATALTSTSAQLNGSGNPDGTATTGWFRYDITNPGTCNDTFGTRAPASGGSALGAGFAAVPFSQTVTGLSSLTTYYYCAIGQSSVGTAFGAVLTFSTPAAPAVTTVAASSVTGSGATLNGSANPNSATSTGWFRYSATNPGTCNDTFGTRTPAGSDAALGAGSAAVAYSQTVSGLVAGTTYYYCAIASNSAGTGFGAVLTFTALAGAPVMTTNAATLVTGSSAQLNGSGNPEGGATTAWFRYATTNPGTCNDTFGTRTPPGSDAALGAGVTAVAYADTVSGLAFTTTYYYCAIGQNGAATSFGAVLTFTTAAGPASNGTTCSLGSQCASGYCVSGVCCNSACNGLCQACSAAATGTGTDGVCSAVAAGITNAQCATQAASTCGQTGTCNGAGACSLYAAGTSCGASVCLGAVLKMHSCDGSGTCGLQAGGTDCTPYACAGSACNTTCTTTSDCAGGYVCNNSACVPPLANGLACSSSAACTSGFCVDGVCCNTACGGTCQACSVGKKGQGASGTCGPILAGSDPDDECPTSASSTCGQNGQCDGAGACQLWAQGTSCGTSACQGTVVVGHVCNGTGTCTVPTGGQDCSPYACTNGACTNPCTGDTDCVSGDFCNAGACKPIGSLGSPCTTTAQCTSGFCADGVCCDGACTGACQACSAAAKGQGTNGACGPVIAGSVCAPGSCTGATATSPSTCDGTGTCAAGTTQACAAGYVCAESGDAGTDAGNDAGGDAGTGDAGTGTGNACATSCVDDSACAAGYQCAGGMCAQTDGGANDAGSDAGGDDAGNDAGSDAGGDDAGNDAGSDAGGDAGESDAGDAGTGGSATDGGMGGEGGAGGSATAPGSKSGCGCRTVDGDASNLGAAMALIGLAITAARRRRAAPRANRAG